MFGALPIYERVFEVNLAGETSVLEPCLHKRGYLRAVSQARLGFSAGIQTDTWLPGYPRSQDLAPHTIQFKGANPFKVLCPKPTAVAHIQLHSVCPTYIWLCTLDLLWMAPKRSAVWEGWARSGLPPPGRGVS